MPELNNSIAISVAITNDWSPDGGVVLTNGILQENDVDFILLESGDFLLQEA
jgi:hypothetical protein